MRLLLVLLSLPAFAADPVELDLAAVVDRFHADSPTLVQLDARVAEARATVRLATAPLQPILAAQGTYTRNNAEVVISMSEVFQSVLDQLPFEIEAPTGLPDAMIIQPLQQLTGGATLQVPIFDGRAWSDWASAKQVAQATEASVAAGRLQAEAALVKACWLSAAAEQQAAAVERAVAAAQEHAARAQRRLDAGLATELDVLVAQTEVARRESALAQAEADVDRVQRGIGALIGSPDPVRVRVPTDLDVEAPAAPSAPGHPTLTAADAVVRATDGQVRSAWLRHAPTLAGSFSVVGSDVDFPTGLSYAWKAGLSLTWVLYDGGARYALLDQAQARRAQAEAARLQAGLDVARQLGDAADGVEVALTQRTLAARAVQTATAAEAAATRAYDAGQLTSLDVLDAQQRRLDAEVARAGAEARVGSAWADLALAMGQPAGQPP